MLFTLNKCRCFVSFICFRKLPSSSNGAQDSANDPIMRGVSNFLPANCLHRISSNSAVLARNINRTCQCKHTHPKPRSLNWANEWLQLFRSMRAELAVQFCVDVRIFVHFSGFQWVATISKIKLDWPPPVVPESRVLCRTIKTVDLLQLVLLRIEIGAIETDQHPQPGANQFQIIVQTKSWDWERSSLWSNKSWTFTELNLFVLPMWW